MIADKLTLTLIYETLFRFEQNVGTIFDIRLSFDSNGSRKSYVLKDVKELRSMVNNIKTIHNIESPSSCFLEAETIYTLVSFGVNKRDLKERGKTSTVYVDTAIDLSVAKEIPLAHAKDLNDLRSKLAEIANWSKKATCYAYVEDMFDYVEETYVEAVKNKSYKLLTKEYKKYVNKNVI